MPARAAEVLLQDAELRGRSRSELVQARDVLYLGRGTSFAIALEGALKLKEISYIHAEGYAAGELKHGPIALIDEDVPVIVVAPPDRAVRQDREQPAGGGGARRQGDPARATSAAATQLAATMSRPPVALPEVDPFVAPLLYAIPVQLLAYHTAVLKGTDVDQPRNLAKSVTVE